MKKPYNKLVVCGCSISSTTKVKRAWGHYLSDKLDVDYLHLATGCGSDKRGFRRLTQAIIAGDVDENSLVLFQPTEVTRREIPSHATPEEYEKHIAKTQAGDADIGATPILEKTLTGRIVSFFKVDSYEWQPNHLDKLVHLHTQQGPGCLDSHFDAEMLSVYYYMLESMCKQKNITLVTIWDGTRGWLDVLKTHKSSQIRLIGDAFDRELWFRVDDFWTNHERTVVYALDPPEDRAHFNTAGHIKLADDIEKFLREKGVLE